MTSEIAVVNANGIALAADSAVTIRETATNETKVYNSSNKLFTLSKFEPVAIMIYGDSTLVGVPWEILIKEFRSHLHDETCGTLEEYVEKFWEYVHSRTDIFTSDVQLPYIADRLKGILDDMVEQVEQSIRNLPEEELTEVGINNKAREQLIKQIEADLGRLKKLEILNGFGSISTRDIIDSYKEVFETALEHFKFIKDILSTEQLNLLFEAVAEMFRRDDFHVTSGVVIAGYGRSEIYPKICNYEVGIFVKDILQHRLVLTNNDQPFYPNIYPFAQDEMVISFALGISNMNEKRLLKKFEKISLNWQQEIASALQSSGVDIKKNQVTTIKELLASKQSEMIGELDACKRDSLTPIIEMLGHLQKGELAEMAESLVNLTVFKQKVSKGQESVDGPIDVAVISKGDGFIWVKRKHYFKPELNQAFLNNYFKQRGERDEQASQTS